MKPIVLSILLATSSAASAPLALAQDSPETDGWKAKSINLAFTGSGVKKAQRMIFTIADGLYSGDATTQGNVAFTCYKGNFKVNIAVDAIDLLPLFVNPPQSTRHKVKRLQMTVDGEKIKSEHWIFIPSMDVYRARTQLSTAKIYNAVIKGQEVKIKAPRKDEQILNLPALDDAFQDFGADCGMGRKAKK